MMTTSPISVSLDLMSRVESKSFILRFKLLYIFLVKLFVCLSHSSQLASLFNMNADSGGAESLKYKATKPPQQQQQQQAASTTSAKSSVLFFTNVQAFK